MAKEQYKLLISRSISGTSCEVKEVLIEIFKEKVLNITANTFFNLNF